LLGYLKGFDQNVVNGWSAGTGAAGLFGTTINLLLRHFQVRDHLVRKTGYLISDRYSCS